MGSPAPYPFETPRWGCPWRVPPASVLGCVPCGGVRVWTRSLTRPVSRTVRLSTGASPGAPGLLRVDADTAPFGSEDDTPGSRACVRVRPLLVRSGGPAPWVRFGAPHLFLWPFLMLSLSAQPPPGSGCPACGCSCGFCFFSFFFFFFLVRPLVSCVSCFPALGDLPLGVLRPPPPLLFFFLPPSQVFFFLPVFFPPSSLFYFLAVVCWLCGALCWCVLGSGACWCVLLWALCFGGGCCALALRRSVLPAHAFSLCVVACCVARAWWRRAGGVALPRAASVGCRMVLPDPPPFGYFARGFFFACPVFAGCAPPDPRLVVVSPVVLCCASCRVVLRSVVCFVLCPVMCGVLASDWVLEPCCSAWCYAGSFFCFALLSCAAAFSADCFFALFLAFPWCSGLCLFLCSACAVLCWSACVVALCVVLSCPCCAGWCFVLLPVVFACLLLGLSVLCCLLVGPGGSWCPVSVVCCVVSLGAVVHRVAARCASWRCVVVRSLVSFCSVWCCCALCCVLGRC